MVGDEIKTVEVDGEACVTTLTLARIEAAYGPLLVVIAGAIPAAEGKTKEDYVRDAWFAVDSAEIPRDLFQKVVAVFKEGVNEPMNQFTAMKARVIDPDFDFTALSRSNSTKLWSEFFGGLTEEPAPKMPWEKD